MILTILKLSEVVSLARLSLLIILLITLLTIGYIRDRYVLDVLNSKGEVLKRRTVLRDKNFFPDNVKGIVKNESRSARWSSNIVYTVLFSFLSTAIIHTVFLNKDFTLITLAIYAIALVTMVLLILLGNFFESFLVYALSLKIKGLIQSPFVIMMLVPLFYFYRKY